MTRAIIDLKNLRHNINLVRKITKNKKILVPVKANAYGHGLVEIARFLEKNKIDYLAVAFSSEGRKLREQGIKMPILVFGIVDDPEDVIKYDLACTVYSSENLRDLEKMARSYNKKIIVHVNVDTGMGRIGISPDKVVKIVKKIKSSHNLILEGLYTHFASADNEKSSYTRSQLSLFNSLIKDLNNAGIFIPLIHAANSSGILNYSDSYFNMVRPGLMIYGYSPNNKENSAIKPTLTLKTKVFHIKTVSSGTSIGYNNNYRAKKKERIATLPIGYGDGYNRLLSNCGKAIIKDKWGFVVGNISMDQTTIRVSDETVKRGTEVILIGKSRTKKITVESIAQQLNTIPYEIVCNLNNRIKREYKL